MPMFWEADSLALIHIKRGAYGTVAPAAALVRRRWWCWRRTSPCSSSPCAASPACPRPAPLVPLLAVPRLLQRDPRRHARLHPLSPARHAGGVPARGLGLVSARRDGARPRARRSPSPPRSSSSPPSPPASAERGRTARSGSPAGGRGRSARRPDEAARPAAAPRRDRSSARWCGCPFWIEALRTPVDGDTAIIGLMARHPGQGVTMWGQPYGSPVEAWLAAPFFAAFGATPATLRAGLLPARPGCWSRPRGRWAGPSTRGRRCPRRCSSPVPPPYLLLLAALPPPMYPAALLLSAAGLALAIARQPGGGRPSLLALVGWGVAAGLALWTHLMTAPVVARGRGLPGRADARPPPALDRRRRPRRRERALVAARARRPAGAAPRSASPAAAATFAEHLGGHAARAPPPAGRRSSAPTARSSPTRPITSCARRSRWRWPRWCCGWPRADPRRRRAARAPRGVAAGGGGGGDDRRLPAAAALGAGDASAS